MLCNFVNDFIVSFVIDKVSNAYIYFLINEFLLLIIINIIIITIIKFSVLR